MANSLPFLFLRRRRKNLHPHRLRHRVRSWYPELIRGNMEHQLLTSGRSTPPADGSQDSSPVIQFFPMEILFRRHLPLRRILEKGRSSLPQAGVVTNSKHARKIARAFLCSKSLSHQSPNLPSKKLTSSWQNSRPVTATRTMC